jgi:enoyl-CoA hydratase
MNTVTLETTDGVAVLTLCDAEHRNRITLDMAARIEDAVATAAAADDVYAVVITGAGTAFCAGADRHLLARADETSLRAVYRAFVAVRECSLPTVAAVNGPAVGAGLNLALSCDVRVAAQSAFFDPRFLQVPIHPGGGHLWMLERLVGRQTAAAMVMLDQALDADRALHVGLVWAVVPDGEAAHRSVELCHRLSGSPTPGLARQIKATLNATADLANHSEAVEYELREQLASTRTAEYRTRMGAAG